MRDLYLRLTYEDYKAVEDQMRRVDEIETSHRTVDGGYHKAIRIKIGGDMIIEFQGPLIKPPLEGPGSGI